MGAPKDGEERRSGEDEMGVVLIMGVQARMKPFFLSSPTCTRGVPLTFHNPFYFGASQLIFNHTRPLNIMSKTGEAQSNLDISLHALVVVSISDHYTRSRVRSGADRVFGMLLGIQQGRKVEIFSSFECAVNPEGQLDAEYLEARKNAGTLPSRPTLLSSLRLLFQMKLKTSDIPCFQTHKLDLFCLYSSAGSLCLQCPSQAPFIPKLAKLSGRALDIDGITVNKKAKKSQKGQNDFFLG